jgi:predicted small lipoprotein YifL
MMGTKRILGGEPAHARGPGIAAAALCAVCLLMLGACGQKGPLIQRPAAPDLSVPAQQSQPPGR